MLAKPTQSKVKLEKLDQLHDFLVSITLWCFLGTPNDPGVLPRVLDATFHHIEGHQYEGMNLKPYLRNDVQYLDPDQVKQERSAKTAIFTSVKTVRILHST